MAWKVSKYGVSSGEYFPVFGLNTERYSEFLRIQSKCGKKRTRKCSLFGHFSHSIMFIFSKVSGSWPSSLLEMNILMYFSKIIKTFFFVKYLSWFPLHLILRITKPPLSGFLQKSISKNLFYTISFLFLHPEILNTIFFKLSLPIYWLAILSNSFQWSLQKIKNAIKSHKDVNIKQSLTAKKILAKDKYRKIWFFVALAIL